MEDNAMQLLEARIDLLIQAYDTLQEENRALREQNTDLTAERATLMAKLELARERVEGMVTQLKSMEIGPPEKMS